MGVLFARVGSAWVPVGAGGGIDQATADGLYVNVAGDIMTGALQVPSVHDNGGTLIVTSDNGNLYLTAAGQVIVVSDGGPVTFSGAELTEIAAPSTDTSAATKAYVDTVGAAGVKVSALAAITGGNISLADLVELVDVSTTTGPNSGAGGQNVKTTWADVITFLNANGIVADGDKGEVTVTGGVWRIDPSAKHLQRFSARAANFVSSPNMATDFVPGTVMDGVTLAQGDEILIMASDPLVSGVWIVSAAGAPIRHPDMDATGDVVGGTEVFIREGTTRQGDIYVAVSTPQPWVPGVTLASWSTLLTNVKGNSFYQVKDTDLTTIAGLTATTDNIIQSVASAWASRTPAQVKATLGVLDNAGPMFNFAWDTTTTSGTSTNGLRANNATLASATILYINYTPKSGVDLKTRILAGTTGDRLYIQDRVNSANYRVYELTGAPTDLTTYASIPVVHRTGGGSFSNGLDIVAGFTSPPMTVGTVAPTSPLTNDIWIDTT